MEVEATNGAPAEAVPEPAVEGGDSTVADLKAKVAAEQQQVVNGNGEHVNGEHVNGNGVPAEESSVPDVAAV